LSGKPVKQSPHIKTHHSPKTIFTTLESLNKSNMGYQLVTGRPGTADYLVFTTTFSHSDTFYKAAVAETISWDGKFTGTFDVLLQCGKGTQRLTLVRNGEQWRAGDEVEQIGCIQQEVVDMLGSIINQVRS
jgi:hypothetical protein